MQAGGQASRRGCSSSGSGSGSNSSGLRAGQSGELSDAQALGVCMCMGVGGWGMRAPVLGLRAGRRAGVCGRRDGMEFWREMVRALLSVSTARGWLVCAARELHSRRARVWASRRAPPAPGVWLAGSLDHRPDSPPHTAMRRLFRAASPASRHPSQFSWGSRLRLNIVYDYANAVRVRRSLSYPHSTRHRWGRAKPKRERSSTIVLIPTLDQFAALLALISFCDRWAERTIIHPVSCRVTPMPLHTIVMPCAEWLYV